MKKILAWFKHVCIGCYTTQETLGFGMGVFEEKKNRDPLTFRARWIYRCDYCNEIQPDYRIKIIKEKKNG